VAFLAALIASALYPASPASASVFVGHSGWFWGNPLPQGNTLRAIELSGDRGYAVGDFGTVLRTDDGGTSWSGLTTGLTAPLRAVRSISPDTIVVGGGCAARRSDDGGLSFRTLPWNATERARKCGGGIASLHFPSSDVGYLLLANGSVLRTQDGGKTWSVRTAVPGTAAASRGSPLKASDTFFTSANTGFAVGDAGVIYRTTDGANSWAPVARSTQGINSVYFPDPITGYAVGGVSVLRTSDGGASWTQQGVLSRPESLDWVRCPDALRCVASTKQGDQLLRTSDGGLNWYSISPASRPLLAAAESPSGQIAAVGEDGTTVVSYDGGLTFSIVGGDLDAKFRRLRAASPQVAYAFGRAGALARTVDGGREWSELRPPSVRRLLDVSFPTPNTGFALDVEGRLFRTVDGGSSWQVLGTGTFLRLVGVLGVSPKRVILIGPHGMRRSTDGGLSFRRVRQRSVAVARLSHIGIAGRLVFAYGRRVLAVSPDGGGKWRRAPLPKPGESLVKVDFPSERLGFALTTDGRVWKTRNLGRRWREVLSVGTEVTTDIAFSDVNHGYVAVSEFGHDRRGWVMRTSDGGTTWRPQLLDFHRIVPDTLAAPGDHTGFAVAGSGDLLATDTGGDLGKRSVLTLSVRRKRPGEPGVITLNGRLTPAEGGETVLVSQRVLGTDRWFFRKQTVAVNGAFSDFELVKKTTLFVAQWRGDDDRVGAGSRVLRVGVGQKYRTKAAG
jgi:photosystem II stability/assembly factor-like uncharacterized protein